MTTTTTTHARGTLQHGRQQVREILERGALPGTTDDERRALCFEALALFHYLDGWIVAHYAPLFETNAEFLKLQQDWVDAWYSLCGSWVFNTLQLPRHADGPLGRLVHWVPEDKTCATR